LLRGPTPANTPTSSGFGFAQAAYAATMAAMIIPAKTIPLNLFFLFIAITFL
jgi:hypothetical protein